jgi:hypothetical protein
MDKFAMAAETAFLEDRRVTRLDHDGFVKVLKGKTLGVVITVLSFGNVFGEEIVRQMTIDAFRSGMMRSLLP